ncbi:cytotoxic necrotizing factor Rho-activating domain-containing protein [Paraburkholderia humisilvae]|nr:cytotoxic necrotizing factor Rho-activating domain-containing protein [Paraburkholderia humisilvae]
MPDRRPPQAKRSSPPGTQHTTDVTDTGPSGDILKRYPDAAQMAPRFLHFEDRVAEIRERQRGGGELSIDEDDALKLYDALHERLAFLCETDVRARGEPVADARVADPPPEEKRQEAKTAGNHGPDHVRYIGGVAIKTDYTLRDVMGITAKAAQSPFASFISSASDLVKKATRGEALSAAEEQDIYRYAGIVDAFAALTPKANVIQRAGDALDSVNALIVGETPDPERLQSDLTNSLKVFQPKLATTTRAPGAQTSGAGSARRGEIAPGDIFDFPRFKIQFPFDDHTARKVDIVRKVAFNPPQRQPDGRVGYPLSPTRPPRLPAGTEAESAAGPSRGEAGEAVGGETAGASKTTGTPLRTDRRRASAPEARARPVGDLKRIAGKGPISIALANTPLDDSIRVRDLGSQFFFYRKDRDITDMNEPRAVRGTDYEHRRDVLALGNGEQATSYVANSKIAAGTFWGYGPATHLQGAQLIELGNGRDGVGAIKLPFASMRPGSTVIVSGGAMNGCTMLFASDGKALYAYHAGSTEMSPNWLTSREGAQSIVDAHTKIGPKDQVPYRWHGTNDDLVTIGRQYPFSALIYSGQYLANTHAVVGAGNLLGAVAGVAETVPNSHLHVARHAYGPHDARRWHMMTFNYYDHNPNQRTVGTAEAVIAKDLNGRVTLSVLAEKGKLDRGSSIGERGGPIAYRYKTMDSDSAVYYPPA